MSDPEPVPLGQVAAHCFYSALTYDEKVRGKLDNEPARSVGQAEDRWGVDAPWLEFTYPEDELPVWPYVVRVPRLFSGAGRETIERFEGPGQGVVFGEGSVTLAGGRMEPVFVAYPAEYIDVLSPKSEIMPWGVAKWWALELSKLKGRAFFQVPHASGTTAMRGDLILALAELGWPGYCYEMRVWDGGRRVWYGEWADHPEWTDYQPVARGA